MGLLLLSQLASYDWRKVVKKESKSDYWGELLE